MLLYTGIDNHFKSPNPEKTSIRKPSQYVSISSPFFIHVNEPSSHPICMLQCYQRAQLTSKQAFTRNNKCTTRFHFYIFCHFACNQVVAPCHKQGGLSEPWWVVLKVRVTTWRTWWIPAHAKHQSRQIVISISIIYYILMVSWVALSVMYSLLSSFRRTVTITREKAAHCSMF
jgi:hypothetical protein